jgi:hypothetical protein
MRRQNVGNQQQNLHFKKVSFPPRTSFAGHLAGILVGLLYTQGPMKKIMETCAGAELKHLWLDSKLEVHLDFNVYRNNPKFPCGSA